MNKYIIIGVIALVAVVTAIFVFFANQASNIPSNQMSEVPKKDTKPLEIVKTTVAPDQAPEGFPANIPIEEGAKILQNYNATAPDGRFQATRVFQTSLTLVQNLNLYRDFLNKDGWKIETTLDLENYKMILGSKANAQLQISIDNNAAIGMKTVNISFTESPVTR